MLNNSSTALIGKPKVVTSDLDRLFPFLLLAITFAALVPALVLGASEFISYDGYWHVFMDTQNRWKLFCLNTAEMRTRCSITVELFD